MNKRIVWFAMVLMVACACGVQAQRMSSGWYWPTGTGNFGGYLAWMGYNSAFAGYHLAQDMKNAAGAPVYSIGNGTVISSGEHSGYGCNGSCSGGCVLARYQSADGTYFTAMYGHLYNYVGTGAVSAGQVIGYTRSDWSPPHLHFSIYAGYDQEPTNPWRGYTSSKSNTYGFVEPMGFLSAHPSGSAPSQPGVGVSNLFPIDNTVVPGTNPAGGTSPYSSGTTLLRGQLHCHSLPDEWAIYDYSGSGIGPTVDKYQARGYDFLAITDHNRMSPESVGWQGWAPNSCEITHGGPGTDVPDGHILAVGTSGGTSFADIDYGSTWPYRADGMVVRIGRTHARGGLAFVAHPNARLLGTVPVYNVPVKTLADVIRRANPEAIAIHSVGSNAYSHWTQVMDTLGRPVWGYVEDDYHPDRLSRDNLARTWVAVPGTPGEWWGDIKTKLRNGNYYCYWTSGAEWPSQISPPLISVAVADGTGGNPRIDVTLSGVQQVSTNKLEFIGRSGGCISRINNPGNTTYSYQCNGNESWVRVRVYLNYYFGTLNIASQPVRVWKRGSYSPYRSSGAGLMSTSPELIVNYLEPEDTPVPPDAGYVSDPVDVTTSDGTVPAGATLELSFEGANLTPVGGTQYLSIYYYDTTGEAWVRLGGVVTPETSTIECPVAQLGEYCVSADIPDDDIAPVVAIDNPPFAGVLNIDTALRATASDNVGVWRVLFYLNGRQVGEDTDSSDGWNVDFAIADYCTGDWTLKTVAEDLAGNTGIAEQPVYVFSFTPRPTVTITTPAAGSTLTGTVTISGTCWDDVAVAAVSLWLDGSHLGYATVTDGDWTCDLDTTALVDGNRLLKAVCEDYPGNSAEASVSVVVNNGATLSSLGDARNAAAGTTVRFSGAIVVADKSTVPGAFYAESTDRSCAVRVVSNMNVSVGDAVSVTGTVGIAGGEKIVSASDVLVLSSGNDLPKPLAIQGNLLLSPPPDSIGKIVTIWGKLGEVDSTNPIRWFTLQDASGIEVKCRLADGVTFDPNWTNLLVTGIAVPESSDTGVNPVVLITPNGSVQSIDGP